MSLLSQTRHSSSSPPLPGSSDNTHVSVSEQIYLHWSFFGSDARQLISSFVVVVSVSDPEAGRKKKLNCTRTVVFGWKEGFDILFQTIYK